MWKDVEETVGLTQDIENEHDTRNAEASSARQEYGMGPSPKAAMGKLSSLSLRVILLLVILCSFALWGFVDSARRMFRSIETRVQMATPHCYCGDTDEQAMNMGCHYDHIAVDWLPDHCIDKDLANTFKASGPGANGSWPYFDVVDSAGTDGNFEFRPINDTNIDELAKVGKGYFATREWHILHCMFTWRKHFRAGYDASRIEPWNNHEEHIRHCSDYIMTTVKWRLSEDVVDTQILGVNRHPSEAEV